MLAQISTSINEYHKPYIRVGSKETEVNKGVEGIYPFNESNLTRPDYVEFAHMMEKYLWPRWSGIDKLDIFIEG